MRRCRDFGMRAEVGLEFVDIGYACGPFGLRLGQFLLEIVNIDTNPKPVYYLDSQWLLSITSIQHCAAGYIVAQLHEEGK